MKLNLTTFLLVAIFLIKLQWSANASTLKSEKCELPTHQTLQIACTTDCGRFNARAIYRFAKKLGYKVNLTNIYSENQTPDISKYDAILIPGGADINPDYYINQVEPELQDHLRNIDYLVDYTSEGRRRDPFEYSLLKNYFASNDRNTYYTPVLGICRGMQMLTVSQGIPLYIDIKKEYKSYKNGEGVFIESIFGFPGSLNYINFRERWVKNFKALGMEPGVLVFDVYFERTSYRDLDLIADYLEMVPNEIAFITGSAGVFLERANRSLKGIDSLSKKIKIK